VPATAASYFCFAISASVFIIAGVAVELDAAPNLGTMAGREFVKKTTRPVAVPRPQLRARRSSPQYEPSVSSW